MPKIDGETMPAIIAFLLPGKNRAINHTGIPYRHPLNAMK
jgi:hypothetical protein